MENAREQVAAARRLAKRSRYAAEEALDEAKHTIKRYPLESVAVSFGLGIAIGTFGTWLYHNGRR